MKEVIVFTSPTCAPCKQLKPVLEDLSAQKGFSLRYVEMKPSNQAEFMTHEVRSVPTVVCVEIDDEHNQTELGRFIGGMTYNAVETQLAMWGIV